MAKVSFGVEAHGTFFADEVHQDLESELLGRIQVAIDAVLAKETPSLRGLNYSTFDVTVDVTK